MSSRKSNAPPSQALEVPDGRNLAARRAYMVAVFKLHGPYSDEMVAVKRAEAIEFNSAFIHKNKQSRVGQAYFEHVTDEAVWRNWFINEKAQGKAVPEWPWNDVKPRPGDMRDGVSPIYAQWLKDHFPGEVPSGDKKTASKAPEAPAAGSSEQPPAAEPKPVPKPEPEPVAVEPKVEQESGAVEPETITAQPEAEPKAAENKPGPEPEPASVPASVPASHELVVRPKTEAKRTLAPAQGLSASRWAPPPSPVVALDALVPKASPPVPRGSMVCPPVPSLAAREHVWKATYGDGLKDEPFCGPFEVRIPCWIEFEELIWGHNGHVFAKVRDVIHRDLAISWEDEKPASIKGGQGMPLSVDYEGRPYKLIVGFSKGVDHTHRANQSLLLALWNSVTGWAGLAHVGTSMTLSEYLRVNQARQNGVVVVTTSGPMNPVRALYEQGRENTLAAQQAAKKEKTAVGQWRCEVHQILQSPLEVATQRLNAWILAGDQDVDLRITVAERVWVEACSNPITLSQGAHWAQRARYSLAMTQRE